MLGASRFLRTICLPLVFASSGAFAVDVDDVVLLHTVQAVTVGAGGTMVVRAEKVTLRERQGREYDYSKFNVHVTAPFPAGCHAFALQAADRGRFVLRVREGALGRGATPSGDKVLVAGADLQSCSWAK